MSVQWRIISSNLPAAWMNTVGICDNFTCYGTADIWPTQTKTSSYPAGEGVFDVTLDLSSFAPDGPYVMKVRLNNSAVTTDTFVQTYIVTRTPGTSSVASVKSSSNVSLYPNPATNSVNLVYDAGADIRNIAVYNIIGKQVSLFRPTDNSSANLNIDNIPSGIYFVRLINSRGDVVSTRKFTKQ